MVLDRSARSPLSRALVLGLVLLFGVMHPVDSQGANRATPSQVKAAFLRNFARYVVWPQGTFPDEDSPWHICIVGHDPFGSVLESTLEGRTEHGRSFAVSRPVSLAKLSQCQIIYVGYKDEEKRQEVLARVRDLPVLTVSDAPRFLLEGGIIRFHVADYVSFGVNLDQARAVSLKVPVKMLEVSSEIVEEGRSRRRR